MEKRVFDEADHDADEVLRVQYADLAGRRLPDGSLANPLVGEE